MTSKSKPIAVSGIQCSGDVHIGNYLGAIKQFIPIQETHKSYFFVADLHALTEPQDPKELVERAINAAAIYLACGLDPQKATLFVQSHVPAHAELGWIFNTITPLGELERMTQFKDKSAKSQKESVLAGLLNYPTLMAADILLYHADGVPVGEDQLQHLELTRTVARKFNSRFGETFMEPKAIVAKFGARIMGLDDPTKKMSKSAPSKNNFIALLDSEDEIRRKIKIAITDSGKEIKYDPEKKPAISNLLTIYSIFSDTTIDELESKYNNKSYADFKADIADVVVQKLLPIQEKYKKLIEDKSSILSILKDGAREAAVAAEETMKDVRKKIGLLEQ